MATKKKKSHALKQELHHLLDELSDRDLYTAKRFMAYLRNTQDPMMQKLVEAPYDDEPLSEEDEAALVEAYEDLAAGRVVSHEEARRRLLGNP
jgi:predicted transcriptional regulator